MCGDWNVNYLNNNGKLQELQNLLLMYNLINVIETPTRITGHSKSLIDVVIINENTEKRLVEVLDIGYSDHLAQYISLKSCCKQNETIFMYNRQYTDMNIDYFKYPIQDEIWSETIESQELNSSFTSFLNTFIYYFNVAFPKRNIKLKFLI